MRAIVIAAAAALCVACAGRDPQPVATVQPTDAMATCAMITAEIQANNIKVQELAGEEGAKVAQNVAAH
jgi:type IV pilus biogenesis protein CpaD/CtpE